MDLISTTLIVIVTILIAFYLNAKYKQNYWARRGVYSPPAHWFFGHLKDAILGRAAAPIVMGNIYQSCVSQKELPVIGIYIMQKPFLILHDLEVIKQVLIKDFNNFSDRYFTSKKKTDVVGSTGIFSIDNPEWKYLRVKLSPAFTTGKQKKFFELMVESADHMKSYLSKIVQGNEKIDVEVRNISSRYTTDVITSLSFGVKVNSFTEPDFYLRSRSIFSSSIINSIQLFTNFFFPKIADLMDSRFLGSQEDYFRKMFWHSMNEREKSGVKRGDIIDFLLELKNENQQDPRFRFEGDRLLAQSAIFFVAGLETSSVTMAFTLLELAKQPDLQKKVRDEIREVIGNGSITYDKISQMTYLQQVISETLRLYPPAPLIDRVALNDYKIPGTEIVIEKGTCVYAVLPGLHNNPAYHPDPEKYDPDRFSNERKLDIKPYSYMPFGEGPRICIGMRTGSLQTMVGLITILREYEFFPNPNFKNGISKTAIFIAPSSEGIHLFIKRNPVV